MILISPRLIASQIPGNNVFGNWSDLIIGFWRGVDIVVDPYTESDKGEVNVTAFLSFDAAIKHPAIFSAMLDALA